MMFCFCMCMICEVLIEVWKIVCVEYMVKKEGDKVG